MELMVSVAIMAIIAVSFGTLLNKADRVVIEGEKRMRADAAASAIARLIRGDVRRMTKNAFLRISETKLVLVTPGKTTGLVTQKSGDGAIVAYGHSNEVLFRKVMVLADEKLPTPTGEYDWTDISMSDLQIMDREELAEKASVPIPNNLDYPPTSLSQIRRQWMVLAGNCSKLEISYRAPDGNDWITDEEGGTWTRHNQAEWPVAIRFRFTINASHIIGSAIADNPDSADEVRYEVLCHVGH